MRLTMLMSCAVLAGCSGLAHVGRAPDLTPPLASAEHTAMIMGGLPGTLDQPQVARDAASLWAGDRGSLLGDRRAVHKGDILTVVIQIDDKAEMSNTTDRARSASHQMGLPQLFGLPQRLNEVLPAGASTDPAVQVSSSSNASGNGSVRRNEKLTLRIAATVVDVLPNGVLQIQGSQEVRVNFELRELLVSGFVRPDDISRQNEVGYDKIASARISYGGRGQISDMQQPRYGQQIAEQVLPF
ncbi:MAG: flagellar basal body L-ring protein FlgH [Limimaricola sp.]|uniref:flagellar basal body L-ring protein FlgH n=1 Tax=Limimaricola sp. TaxID=2211665 RepID=UPI001D7357D4|nr:flagellar basal body L-ring protein FlgH [Limimaricola sp.]MBI1417340.1 flagellar basal body L-ring protein FlgH [Limimaricola sp.]